MDIRNKLAEIKKINLNQDDYIIDGEEFDDIAYEEDIVYFDDLLGYCIVTGAVQRWDGKQEIMPEALKLEQVLGRLNDTLSLEIVYDKEDKCVAVLNHHHDGTNRYCLKPFELVTKKELSALAKDIKEKCISEDEEVGGIADLNKDELFEFVVENLDCLYN